MKTTKFLLNTAAMLSFVFVTTTGCKEEESLDPNIAYKTYSISMTNTTSAIDDEQELSFDINGDGDEDFRFEADFENVGGDTTITQIGLRGEHSDDKILTEDYVFPGGQNATKLRALSNGYTINDGSEFSEQGFAVLTANKGVTTLGDFGFTDGTDKLVGFYFYNGTARHYGWFKLNVSSDLKTITLKEGAYHKTPDTAIGAGDK